MSREHAINVITRAAAATKLSRKDFVAARYLACPRFDVSKDEIAEIYDRAREHERRAGKESGS